MRKSMLTVAAACLIAVTGVFAADRTESNERTAEASIVLPVEVNSFCKAIMQGDYDTVKRMIELGEDINKKSLGLAPIHFAARYNKADILQLLIDNGASLGVRSDKGYTAKKYAQLSNAMEALAVIDAAKGS